MSQSLCLSVPGSWSGHTLLGRCLTWSAVRSQDGCRVQQRPQRRRSVGGGRRRCPRSSRDATPGSFPGDSAASACDAFPSVRSESRFTEAQVSFLLWGFPWRIGCSRSLLASAPLGTTRSDFPLWARCVGVPLPALDSGVRSETWLEDASRSSRKHLSISLHAAAPRQARCWARRTQHS